MGLLYRPAGNNIAVIIIISVATAVGNNGDYYYYVDLTLAAAVSAGVVDCS